MKGGRLATLGVVFGLLLPLRVLSQPATIPYTLQTNLTVSGLVGDDNFGGVVAVDGNTFVVAAPWEGADPELGRNIGAAYVFQRNAGAWVPTQRLTREDGPGGGFGDAVALDGEWMVIGRPGTDLTNSSGTNAFLAGTAHVFRSDGAQWEETQMLQRTEPVAVEFFGRFVAISGHTIVVGTSEGLAVDVFEWDGSVWTRQASLVPAGLSGDNAGGPVAINEDASVIVIGQPGHETSFTREGSVFVFVRDGTNWVEQPGLAASDPAQFASFGRSVSISGETIVATASRGTDDPGGAVHVFERGPDGWGHQARLTASVPTANDFFGSAVRIRDGLIVAGAYVEEAVYVFEHGGFAWNLRDKLTGIPSFSDLAFRGPWLVAGSTADTGTGLVYTAYDDPVVLADYVRNLLYHPQAQASGAFDPNQSAFRYKHLLYAQDNGGVRARHEMMADFYGPAERQRAGFSEKEVAKGLILDPGNAALGNLLLDIHYDRTVAESVLARNVLTQAESARFGPPIAPPAGGSGFIIDNEIPVYRQLLAANHYAIEGYFSLLSDDLEIPGDPPRGYQLFRDLVPDRELMAATYIDGGGMNVPVTQNDTLFTGYKDLVLLFDLLRDHGRSAATLARLLISRDGIGDRDEAETVVAGAERFLFLQGVMLKSLFTDLPPEGDPSGLAEAIAGWSQCLRDLGTVEHMLNGGGNVLGFADDFMMYVQKFTGQTEFFDSYDAFRERLEPGAGSNPLQSAKQAHQDALDSYEDYRGFQDQLLAQFDNSSITYRDRLRDIVGVFPEDLSYGDDPTANPGSELDQQFRSIEVADLRIQRNQTEISNLRRQVQIELNKAASISNVMIRFGEQQARLTETIGDIEAIQAECNALAAAFSPEKIVTGLFVADVVNAGAQAGLGLWKARLEADKERLAARQQATITGMESDAVVKTLLLQMNTLAIDSREAALLHQQEVNRLVGLYREKGDLERDIAEHNTSVAERYFADPVHRLASRADMVSANLAFNEARKWLYFMVRALEYKWNTPFRNVSHAGRTWSADTLFHLRNASELELMFQAMDIFDNLLQPPKDDYFDWFSVRDDFLGYKRTNHLGQSLSYADPVTGATVDAITAFRSRLSQFQDAQGNIVLRFSTVTEIPGGTFFRGPRFDAQGQVISKGLFLDKIRWLKISLPGSHTLGRSQLTGELRYGGTAFVRNWNVGTFDPARPDRLRDELTAYSTRFWFFDGDSAAWRFTEALSSPVTMQVSDDPRVPPSVQELDVFKERSVATTGWVLTIPTHDLGQPVLNIGELDDVEIFFLHYAVTRL